MKKNYSNLLSPLSPIPEQSNKTLAWVRDDELEESWAEKKYASFVKKMIIWVGRSRVRIRQVFFFTAETLFKINLSSYNLYTWSQFM